MGVKQQSLTHSLVNLCQTLKKHSAHCIQLPDSGVTVSILSIHQKYKTVMVINYTNISKTTIASHLKSLGHKKNHGMNPGPGFGQAQKCGRVKDSKLDFLIIRSPSSECKTWGALFPSYMYLTK